MSVEVPGAPEPEEPSRRKRILVVDDEPQVRTMVERMLGRLGFDSQSVADAAEAQRALEDRANEFDAVITDLSMPGLTGTDLAAWMAAHRPLPCVLMSGLLRDPARMQNAPGVHVFLNKPFQLGQLEHAVKTAMALVSSR